MDVRSSALARAWRYAREVVHQVRSGDADMRDLYGENPSGVSDAERIGGAAALGNLGTSGGGMGF